MADLVSGLQESLGGSYTIERELGGGGMSRVYIAEDASLGRRVALKVLPPELAGPINADRFRREILLAAKLQDPHIVPVLSAGQTADGTPYYTMPLVEGESLRARLARHGALPIRETLRILRDVAKALAYAHELGVVHRDIKPDNVLLTRRDALVADFGVAKAVSSARDEVANPTLTVAGTALGTPAYMAPEQVAADPNVDHRADLYAFGVMAYEMLAGQPPFVGSAPQRILAAHLSQTPEDILNHRPDTPAPLASLVMRCLAKEPVDRPSSATTILEELDALITSGGYASGPAVAEATRRSFGRALGLYALAFAAVALLARASVVGIGLPDWVFTGALILMALGLPVVLFTGLIHHHSRVAQSTAARTPGGSTMATSTMTQLSLKAHPHVSWKRTAGVGVLALAVFVIAVAGYMAMRAMGIGPAGSLLAAGVLDQRAPVLVAEFENNSPDSLLGSVLSEAFRTDLGQSRVVTTVQPVFVQEALQRMQRDPNTRLTADVARELAAREGIRLVVEGEVTPVGAGYVLATRLVAPSTGEVLAAFRETASSSEQLIPAIDRLSKRTRQKIGESIRSVRGSAPLEQVTTGSLDALRKYTQALEPTTSVDRQEELLQEAVALDSTFAMAYRRLGTLYANRGDGASARQMIQRAYALRDRLPAVERYLTEGSYWGTAMGDRPRAIAAYESALEVAPTNRVALNNVALLYTAENDYARAEQYLRRAIAADSNFWNGYLNLVFGMSRLGNLTEARRVMDVALARFPQSFELATADINLRYVEGDPSVEERVAALESRARTVNDRLMVGQLKSVVAIRHGRVREYFQLRSGVVAIQRQRMGAALIDGQAYLDSIVTMALLRKQFGTIAPAAERLARSAAFRSIPVEDRPYLQLAQSAAYGGNVRLARELMQEREAQVPEARRAADADAMPWVRASLAMGEKDFQSAVNELRSALDGPCPVCTMPPLAAAYDSLGMRDSTIAMYERYLANRDLDRMFRDGANVALVHERLGELYEARGDRERAIRHYTLFADGWANADPELQPRVRAARAAVNRLRQTSS